MKIDVVIVNWNAGSYLEKCVDSIVLCEELIVDQIIIVDNNSSDNSIASVASKKNIKIIFSEINLGFGAACNLGALQSDKEYLLFLNPDAALLPNGLTTALSFMRDPKNTKFGICGVQLLDESGQIARSCARFPTPLAFFSHAVGLNRIFPKMGHFMAEWSHEETREVDHVIGAFFMVRRSLFDALAGFDERFFLYLEDLDFSYRARQAGWRTVYLAHAQAFHAGGGTSNQVKAKRLFYSLRSRLLYAFKHFGVIQACFTLLVTLLVEPVSRFAQALARRSWPALKETWSGYALLWQWLPKWIFKGETR